MDAIERIKELLEEISPLIQSEFPNYTGASVRFCDDGRICFDVVRHIYSEPVEQSKRRVLLDIGKFNGEWENDHSNDMNNYYAQCGCLLREDE